MSARNHKLLLIGPVPPPFAGPEVGTRMLLDSPTLNARFDIAHINTTVRASNRDKGKRDLALIPAFFRYATALWRAVSGNRTDVILYTPTAANRTGLVRDILTMLLAGRWRTPLVMQFRGGHYEYFFRSQPRWLRGLIKSLLNQYCALMLVQAERLRAQFAGILPAERIIALPNAIPFDFFSHFDRCDRHESASAPTILFIGHLSIAKGYGDLLRVMPRLARERNARLLLVGSPEVKERNVTRDQKTGATIKADDVSRLYSEQVVAPGLEAHVEFLGDTLDGIEKLRAFARADIFVLPSYSEGFSRSILEAMAAELPVVVTRVGAAEEIIEDGVQGFLLDPGDTDALHDRLDRLARDEHLRREMGKRARARVAERFLDAPVSEQLASVLGRAMPIRS